MPVLAVPAAELYYQVTGSGPLVLLVAGAPADATQFAAIAPVLARRHTVVTYDPRGYTRSKLANGPVEQHVGTHGDDAHRLLAALTAEPAHVIGIGGGALTGIELAIRHPRQVRTLLAYEPPVMDVLDDAASWRRCYDDIVATYHREGPFAAATALRELTGLDPGAKCEVNTDAAARRSRRNLRFFFEYQFTHFAHIPDMDALRATGVPVVWATGSASSGLPCHRATVELARWHREPVVGFPGDHNAITTHPEDFAAAWCAAMSRTGSPHRLKRETRNSTMRNSATTRDGAAR
ncbi:alpha/beta fold hydrolase [Fodinicola acaciae]|uniref:alpha/beta fold hydrolase n=1 Tax=Fodinicola acaciae TaxID=2681555 RepID=UPI0013D0A11F|nr:alpha/beta hydrolase [Fodinicola acaciae]